MLRRLKLPHNLLRTPLNRVFPFALVRRLTTEQENDARTRQFFSQELLPEIKTILALENDEINSQRWMHATLKEALKNVPSPHKLLEDVLSFLLRKGFPTHAFTVFQRLRKAGFHPTNHVLAQMLIPLIHSENQNPIQIAQSIVHLVTDTEYSDSQLHTLLQVFSSYKVDEGIVISIINAYRESQGPDYVPSPRVLSHVVNAAVHFGKIEDAFELLSRGSYKTKARAANDHNHIFYAFFNLLTTLRDLRTEDSRSIARVVDLMGSRGWLVNVRLFDVLISREVAAGNPRVAMSMYSILKDLGATQSIRPTRQTFGSLFAIYRRMKPKVFKSLDPNKPVSFFLPLRVLSRELDEAVNREERPLKPSTAVLNTALRAYMRQRDYPGAFVTLESFARYGVPLDHRTYHSILKLIIRRIWYEIAGKRKVHEVRWADRFLGVSYQDVELAPQLVGHILYVISREEFNITDPMYPRPPEREFEELDDKGLYKVPTVLMMEHKYRPEPWDFRYEAEPLLRLMRRAILAECRNWSLDSVEEAITKAEEDMLRPSHSHSSDLMEENQTHVAAVAATA